MKLEEADDEGTDTYRATDWEPYEVSLVSMPADVNVGVGPEAREWQSGESDQHDTIVIESPEKDLRKMSAEMNRNFPAASGENFVKEWRLSALAFA